MKAMMMSIRPKHVKNILNCIKTLEIRKKFPKDYVGLVYIYCTKDKKYANLINRGGFLTGMVVARFWCDKVEEIKYHFGYYNMGEWAESYILENSCLTAEELDNYLQASKEYDEKKVSKVYGYAIHITKLEIFDKPKEISEFKSKLHIKNGCKNCPQNTGFSMPYCATCDFLLPLNRAPQSYQFIEI